MASWSLNADGSFEYTPVAGFAGVDSFTYFSSDGMRDGNVATVTIDVTNCAPTTIDDWYSDETC